MEGECFECKLNAQLRDGVCECSEEWEGYNCDIYTGSCYPECAICFEPGPNAECLECVPNATLFRDMCQCDEYWHGSACDSYQGPCDPRCFTCFGPTNSECHTCSLDAFRTELDTCEYLECPEHCENCVNHICEFCRAGYYLEQGSCYPCHEECSACAGPPSYECFDCVAGFTLVDQ